MEYTFTFRIFEAICACPEKQSVPCIPCTEYIFFIIQNFYQLALALQTEFDLKIFSAWNALFTFRIFEHLALSLKNRVCPEFTVLNMYFLSFKN